MLAVMPLAGSPLGVWIGLAGLLPGLAAARMLVQHPEWTSAIIPAQRRTLLPYMLYSIGAGAGLLLH